MSFENIVFQVDQGVATITFSRPKALNALNQALLAEFAQALDAVAADESVRVLILTGAGEKPSWPARTSASWRPTACCRPRISPGRATPSSPNCRSCRWR